MVDAVVSILKVGGLFITVTPDILLVAGGVVNAKLLIDVIVGLPPI
jgi:hypothetical protein